MHTYGRALVLLAVLAAAGAPRAAASQAVCRAPDSTSAALIRHLARYSAATSGDDAEVRQSLGLPYTPAAQVTLVTTESVCEQAYATYRADRAGKGGGLSRRAYVVAIGNTYAVLDPSYKYDPSSPRRNWTILIVNSQFERLSLF